MDDWGTSVWDTPTEPIDLGLSKPASLSPPPEPSPALDEFDDFGEPGEPSSSTQDDFGDDFGDFDGGIQIQADMEAFEGDIGGFQDTFTTPIPSSTTWVPLRLDPLPSSKELSGMVEEILDSVWLLPDAEEVMTGEDIRQVEGLNQVLVTPER